MKNLKTKFWRLLENLWISTSGSFLNYYLTKRTLIYNFINNNNISWFIYLLNKYEKTLWTIHKFIHPFTRVLYLLGTYYYIYIRLAL